MTSGESQNVITHGEVVENIIASKWPEGGNSAKVFRSTCKAWLRFTGTSSADPAMSTLGTTYTERLQEFERHLESQYPGKPDAGKNVRTAAKAMRDAYERMVAEVELPLDFHRAFRMAMDRKGFTPAQMNTVLKQRYFRAEKASWNGTQIYYFYDGTASPGYSWRGSSHLMLERIEEVLELPKNALISRAYKPIEPIKLGPPGEIPFRAALSAKHGLNYALPKLPPQFNKIWLEFADWRQRKTHLINGLTVGTMARSRWTGQGSVHKNQAALLRFFGFLCLPAPTKPSLEMTEEEHWMTGKGYKPEELKLAHLFDVKLHLDYIEFQAHRQHNKVTARGHLDAVFLASSFTSTPHCFLLGHSELAGELGLPIPADFNGWANSVEGLHQSLLGVIRGLKHSIETKQRSPDEPLRHVLNEAQPYSLFLKLVQRHEKHEPLKALTQTWAVWSREIALFRMQLDIPLRLENVANLRVGLHLHRDPESGIWRVEVPKRELKNNYSKHAEDIGRDYTIETSVAMDRYYDHGRKSFIGYGQSDYFFLGSRAGPRANIQRAKDTGFRMSNSALSDSVGKLLKLYFGQTQGMNIFRHLIATSILKDDHLQVEVAAAVLNNSPDVIRANYKHLTQKDGLRHADRWFARKRNQDTDDGNNKG